MLNGERNKHDNSYMKSIYAWWIVKWSEIYDLLLLSNNYVSLTVSNNIQLGA